MPIRSRRLIQFVAWNACLVAVPAALAQTGTATGGKTAEKPAKAAQPGAKSPARISYPTAQRSDATDTYFGVKVADPYVWLEKADNPDSRAWIDAENTITATYLAAIPERDAIRKRLTELWDYEKFGIPGKEGGHYFFTRNTGLQKQSVLMMTSKLDQPPQVLIDPNDWSKDGTVALGGSSPSHDGKHFAYAVADAGSDWNTWKVKDLSTGKDAADELHWVKFSGASWTKDDSGFFYNRYKEPPQGESLKNADQPPSLCFHSLGTPQSSDAVVFEKPDQKDWLFGGAVTDDGRYLVIGIEHAGDVNNNVFYKDLKSGMTEGPTVELLKNWDAQYSFIDNDGPVFWFLTDTGAPRRKIIAIDTTHPEKSNWNDVIPQSDDAITGANVVGEKFIVSYLHDAQSVVKVFDLHGKFERNVDLPGIGAAGGFGGKRSDTETFYSYTSYTTPTSIYRYDIPSGKSEVFRKPTVKFNPDEYETKQVFYNSKDGTKIPMFITHKKSVTPGPETPTLLYGYGGFDISITPAFSPANLVWMEMGGVYCVPNIRGGGEYGRDWHLAGTKTHKQNVFDDFIAAAEYLIHNKHTSTRKLAIFGGSNGGLLVGACMTQRPDLYGACLPAVGVMDMLKYHTFNSGRFWMADYGSVENEDEFKALRAYSPYHNIKPGTCYPPTLITTADHDDRVFPAHSMKFAAAMQAAQSCENPVLIRIETRAGHGAGKPTDMRIKEIADQWAFLVKTLGMSSLGTDMNVTK